MDRRAQTVAEAFPVPMIFATNLGRATELGFVFDALQRDAPKGLDAFDNTLQHAEGIHAFELAHSATSP